MPQDEIPQDEKLSPEAAAAEVIAKQFGVPSLTLVLVDSAATPAKPNTLKLKQIVWDLDVKDLMAIHMTCLEQLMGSRIQMVSYENGFIAIPHADLVPDDLRDQLTNDPPGLGEPIED